MRDVTRTATSGVRHIALGVGVALTAWASATSPSPLRTLASSAALQAQTFALPAPPEKALGPDLQLWATHYHTPILAPAPKEASAVLPLLGGDNAGISLPLRQQDWCEAALQGSASMSQNGKATAYVFLDAKGPEQTNCDAWLGNLSQGVKTATRRVRFMAVNHPLGCGVRNLALMPFRTIAVDPSIIPIGSVIFVPELRGRAFTYEDRTLRHDGYLFAGDQGGAIRGRHVDVFMLDQPDIPFEDIFASTSARTFAAHIVEADHPWADAVRLAQDGQCTAITPN